MKIEEKDREKVLAEISECQGRILPTLVPTILSVALISIADRKNFALITLVSAFSVLFASSLYVASLSYKIFRNASFIRVFTGHIESEDKVHWEKALSKFNENKSSPMIIGFETKTIAIIYIVFSMAYTLMFYSINSILAVLLGIVLAIVALRIYFIPSYSNRYDQKWERVLEGYDK